MRTSALLFVFGCVVLAANACRQGHPYRTPDHTDPSFGTDGETLTGRGSGASSIAIGPAGEIVLAGVSSTGFTVVRLDATGHVDPAFGVNGMAALSIGTSGGGALTDVAVRPDGRILAAGSWKDFNGDPGGTALAQFLPDGTLDATFGSAGVVTDTSAKTVLVVRVVLLPDGSFLTAGPILDAGSPFSSFGVARRHADATLDTSFGIGGFAEASVAGAAPADVAVTATGGIVVVGGANALSGASTDAVVVRFDSQGVRDPAFGNAGIVVASLSGLFGINNVTIRGAALLADGSVIVAGSYYDAPETWGIETLVSATGGVVTTFGDGGLARADLHSEYARVAVDSSGRILGAGGGDAGFWVDRRLPDGRIDREFGVQRALLDALPSGARSICIQPDGRVVLGGYSGDAGGGFAAARFLP